MLFSGDLVEYDAACYCGDAQLEQWPATLEAARALVRRGALLLNPADVNKGLDYTKDFVTTLLAQGRKAGESST